MASFDENSFSTNAFLDSAFDIFVKQAANLVVLGEQILSIEAENVTLMALLENNRLSVNAEHSTCVVEAENTTYVIK